MDSEPQHTDVAALLNEAAVAAGFDQQQDIITAVNEWLLKRGERVSQQAVRKWFAGESLPTGANLLALANVLNFDVDLVARRVAKIPMHGDRHDGRVESMIMAHPDLSEDQAVVVIGVLRQLTATGN